MKIADHTMAKEDADKKIADLTTVKNNAEGKLIDLEKANSDLKVKVATTEKERGDVEAKRKIVVSYGLEVGHESFDNSITQLKFLKSQGQVLYRQSRHQRHRVWWLTGSTLR